MSLYNASSFEKQTRNNPLSQSHIISDLKPKVAKNWTLKLWFMTLIATMICLPNLGRAANAANLDVQTKVVTEESKQPAFLPRILNLIPAQLKNKLENLSGVDEPAPVEDIFLNTQVTQNLDQKYFTASDIASNQNFSIAADFKSPTLAPPSVKAKLNTHQVQSGDTLSTIANKYQVSLDELIKLNQINNSDIILVDRQLIIPKNTINLSPSKIEDRQSKVVVSIDFPNERRKSSPKLASTDLKTKVLKGNLPPQEVAKTKNLAKLEEDPYIAKLKAEIEQMRAEYRQELKREKLEEDRRLASVNRENPTSLPSSTNSIEKGKVRDSVAVSLDRSINDKPSLDTDLFLQDSIALQLPPLPASEEFLPSAFDGYTWPAQGVLTSGYGWRWGRLHGGIDIAAPVGTPIVAAASGKVISAGWNSGGYGNLVKLEHLDGSVTVYAHNNRILVSNGQKVSQGDIIAEMGSTGRSTGSHLHFEIHPRSQGAVNPLAFLH